MTTRQRNLGYMGRHTPASFAKETGAWKNIPLLRENQGQFPPNIMVVGDRRRVVTAAKALQLKHMTMLHDAMPLTHGESSAGRVNVAIGAFELDGNQMPLTIMETQMGCSGQEINARELISLSSPGPYVMPEGDEPKSTFINIVRAGTCGGINSPGKDPTINIGDAIIATKSFGWVGAALQQELGPDYVGELARRALIRLCDSTNPNELSPDELTEFLTNMLPLPSVASDARLVKALLEICEERGIVAHLGGNHTKDSLYVEADEESVVALRDKHGILSTEMEHFGLAKLAELFSKEGKIVRTALISTAVGLVPGGSFAAPGTPEEERAKNTEESILYASACALHRLAFTDENWGRSYLSQITKKSRS